MMYLTKKQLNALILGSSFFATGGGIPHQEHKQMFEELFNTKDRLLIKRSDEFNESDYLASVYAVGDAAKAKTDLNILVKAALKEYEKVTGIAIKGIIPGEIGAEGLAFQAGAILDLPVVDSDLVGGRAAPEISMDVFSVFKIPIAPVFGISSNNKTLLVRKGDAQEIERTLRNFFADNGGVGVIIGYLIKAKEYDKICAKKTISRSLKIGACLSNNGLNAALKELNGTIIAKEKLKDVMLVSEAGFLVGSVIFENFKILVKNENLALFKKNERLISAPDSIVLLDEKMDPIHNKDIKKHLNKEIVIVHLPPYDYWNNENNKELWQTNK